MELDTTEKRRSRGRQNFGFPRKIVFRITEAQTFVKIVEDIPFEAALVGFIVHVTSPELVANINTASLHVTKTMSGGMGDVSFWEVNAQGEVEIGGSTVTDAPGGIPSEPFAMLYEITVY